MIWVKQIEEVQMTTAIQPIITRQAGEPTWEIADLFPRQGDWDEAEYLAVTDGSNRLIELVDGYVEVLPVPTETHQDIIVSLFDLLRAFTNTIGGKVYFAGLRVRTRGNNYREPDLALLRSAQDPRRGQRYWEGADLVVEVVSDSAADHERDYIRKRLEYAIARIPEYWIVDPQAQSILVLTLKSAQYIEHGRFVRGEVATSPLLPGLQVNVSAVLVTATAA